jgi:hypothetical protein
MKRINTLLVVAAALLAAGLADLALGQTALQRRLEAATRIDCTFSTLVTADWPNDVAGAEVEDSAFEASFFDVNIDEGTAEADGRFGASYIVVRYTFGYLHLMQMFNSGPLYLTTVLAQETTDGRLMAVHTRHEYTPTRLPGFTSRPEMYVGDCAVEG